MSASMTSLGTSSIRLATPDDAGAVCSIYGAVVEQTATSFELQPPDEHEMRRRISATLAEFPWLVYESGGRIFGYAYAGKFRTRPAYRWTAEVSVYLGEGHRGVGLGKKLYGALLDCLRVQGCRSAVAGITLPNPASVALHERLGFRPVGVFARVGYKFGRWHDVGWWQVDLQELPDPPPEPQEISALRSLIAGDRFAEPRP